MRWLELVWATPILIGLGCGGTVNFSSNGGSSGSTSTGGSTSGIGGAGGATTTTTTTSGTTTTTSGTTTTTTAAMCADACPKVESCGLPANQCAQYLDCNTMQGQCLAACVNDPTVMCSDIIDAFQTQSGPFYDCTQACQGGQGGAGGGVSQACQQCGQNNCQNQFVQCAQQAGFQECQAWLSCVQGCGDSACADACTAAHPAAAPIAQCVCSTCSNDCGTVCSGAGGAGGGGMGGAGGATNTGSGDPQQCQQCGQSQCGTELQQCFGAGFQQCQAWINCTQACQDKACVDACTAQNPAGASLGTCICTKCSPGGCAYTCD